MCWFCGVKGKMTRHHVIPQSMKPLKNATIPLCNECHKKLHITNGDISSPRREIVYFMKVKKGDKEKIQGNISNGKVVFPDHSENIDVKPNKYYDCLIHQTPNVAFARDIKQVEVVEL